jgi:hypothetical protein
VLVFVEAGQAGCILSSYIDVSGNMNNLSFLLIYCIAGSGLVLWERLDDGHEMSSGFRRVVIRDDF